jgi:hypothetical protein
MRDLALLLASGAQVERLVETTTEKLLGYGVLGLVCLLLIADRVWGYYRARQHRAEEEERRRNELDRLEKLQSAARAERDLDREARHDLANAIQAVNSETISMGAKTAAAIDRNTTATEHLVAETRRMSDTLVQFVSRSK